MLVRSRRRAWRAAALAALAFFAVSIFPAPASAIGVSLQLTVSPPQTTGTPTASSPGEANFSGAVDLLSNPVGRASIRVSIVSQFGWTISPAGFNWAATGPDHFPFNFTVEVPTDSVAGRADSIEVTVDYLVGGVSTYTDTVTVHAEAGGYYAGSVRRQSPAVVMDPGKTYVIDFDVRNEGNAPALFAFTFPDQGMLDRLRAQIDVPDGPTLAGQNNTTVQFRLTPGGTSPAGKYQIPIRMELRDRMGSPLAVVNFTMDVEVNNLAIYQGFFPNWNLRGPYSVGVLVSALLLLWFAVIAAAAVVRALRGRTGFVDELKAGLQRSRLTRAVRSLGHRVRGAAPGRKAPKRPLTPDEVRGKAGPRPTAALTRPGRR
jgi:hypothetical protein